MTLRRLCIAIAPLLVTACGGGSSIAQADFASQFATAYCAKVIACCSTTAGLPTQAACVTAVTPQYQAEFTAALADTKISYNGSAASSCVSEFSANTCGEAAFGTEATVAPDCNLYLTGTVANGQPCTVTSTSAAVNECQSGLCINITTTGSTSTGVCAAPAAIGSACPTFTNLAIGYLCVSGSFSDYSSGSCKCTAVQANATACTASSQCSSGYCDTTTNPGTPVCAALPANASAGYCAGVVAGT